MEFKKMKSSVNKTISSKASFLKSSFPKILIMNIAKMFLVVDQYEVQNIFSFFYRKKKKYDFFKKLDDFSSKLYTFRIPPYVQQIKHKSM